MSNTPADARRRRSPALIIGGALVAMTAGGVSVSAVAPEASDPVHIDVALSTGSPYYYGLWVAHELGFFEEEGLDVEFNITGGSSDVAAIVAANNVDIGSASTEPLLPVFEAGGSMYPFYVYTVRVPYELLVPADSEIQSVTDLDGGTIGVSELSGGETTVVRAALEQEGLVPDEDVTIIEVGTNPGSIQLALERGDIDALGIAASDAPSLAASSIETRSIMPAVFGVNDSPGGHHRRHRALQGPDRGARRVRASSGQGPADRLRAPRPDGLPAGPGPARRVPGPGGRPGVVREQPDSDDTSTER